jgi:hypothetical protein
LNARAPTVGVAARRKCLQRPPELVVEARVVQQPAIAVVGVDVLDGAGEPWDGSHEEDRVERDQRAARPVVCAAVAQPESDERARERQRQHESAQEGHARSTRGAVALERRCRR